MTRWNYPVREIDRSEDVKPRRATEYGWMNATRAIVIIVIVIAAIVLFGLLFGLDVGSSGGGGGTGGY
jgi:hypothetical protein